jgi:hypothetical protein
MFLDYESFSPTRIIKSKVLDIISGANNVSIDFKEKLFTPELWGEICTTTM